MKLSLELSHYLYVVFRVGLGILFFMHGVQKLFIGSFPLLSLMGIAGLVEFFGGLLIIIGLWMRPVALISSVQMLVAYIIAHASQGWNPLTNQGELALLFLVSFLVLLGWGSGKLSIDALLQ